MPVHDSSPGLCPVTFTQEGVRTIFILFTVCWWVGYPLSFIVVGLPFLIAAIAFSCILMYRHWLLLQGHGARTTPGKAVGFGFIPVFWFYWWFVEYAGLARNNNRYMLENRIVGPDLSCDLAIAVCVVSILCCTIGLVHYLGLVLAIPHAILGFMFVRQQRDCILAIMKHRESCNQPANAAGD